VPKFEYGYLKYGTVIERLEKHDHLPLSICPTNQGEIKRLFSMTAQPVRGNTPC
jgi:hypothetical protein